MSARSEKELLEAFKMLLVGGNVLTNKEAEAYITIVNTGQATAADIYHRLRAKVAFRGISKQTIHGLLGDLEQKGFIKSAITSGKRSHSKPYRPTSPEEALSEYFSATEKLKDVTDDIVTLLELKEKQGDSANNQCIWMHEPKRIALREGIKYLKGAQKSILMFCNDYSWIEEPGVTELLTKKTNEGVGVKILGGTPVPTLESALRKFDKVRRETDIPCVPYSIIDDEQLLIFLNEGFDPKLLATKNIYMVERHSAQFRKVWNGHSTEVWKRCLTSI
jgi:sugar-specific transcriptional regulator TrmB